MAGRWHERKCSGPNQRVLELSRSRFRAETFVSVAHNYLCIVVGGISRRTEHKINIKPELWREFINGLCIVVGGVSRRTEHKINIKPERRLPGNVYAVMWGSELWWEFINGEGKVAEVRLTGWLKKFWLLFGAQSFCSLTDINTVVVMTHLQKKMRWGFYLSTGWRSWCFHFWFHWHMQERGVDGTYVPNTERGIYFRTPGWRWDLEEGMRFTGGRIPGAHWD